MSMILVCVLGELSAEALQLVARDDIKDVPLQLQQRVSFAGAQRSKRHERVFYLTAIFVEFGVHKTVVFELLQKNGKMG